MSFLVPFILFLFIIYLFFSNTKKKKGDLFDFIVYPLGDGKSSISTPFAKADQLLGKKKTVKQT